MAQAFLPVFINYLDEIVDVKIITKTNIQSFCLARIFVDSQVNPILKRVVSTPRTGHFLVVDLFIN